MAQDPVDFRPSRRVTATGNSRSTARWRRSPSTSPGTAVFVALKQSRLLDDLMEAADLKFRIGRELDAEEAMEIGLVTFAPDDIYWKEEVRLARGARRSRPTP